ncbi:MAG: type VI secretion protein IcmF/TssM N-terminal domain-containing protein [Planctomycetota bacterium]
MNARTRSAGRIALEFSWVLALCVLVAGVGACFLATVSWTAVILTVGSLVFATVVWFLARAYGSRYQSRRSSQGLASELSAQPTMFHSGFRESTTPDELKLKFSHALDNLRATLGPAFLYELPWYLLIGESGSGKSTSLRRSNIKWPLGGERQGIGGTVSCDWWFADEAVILDTAGRFSVHGEMSPSEPVWDGFLDLLKKYRPRRPIDGVVLTIPADALIPERKVNAERFYAEAERKAAVLREKLMSLEERLGFIFPVFILVTKCDKIRGFEEFSSALHPAAQQSLFGWGNPHGLEERFDPSWIDEVFQGLRGDIGESSAAILKSPESLRSADLIYLFPDEFAATKDFLKIYLAKIFEWTRFQESHFFRGIFFSSSGQDEMPLSSLFDLGPRPEETSSLDRSAPQTDDFLRPNEELFGRPYFVQDFYEKKVFGESGLSRPSKRTKGARTASRGVLALAACLLCVLGSAGIAYVFAKASGSIETIAADVTSVAQLDFTGGQAISRAQTGAEENRIAKAYRSLEARSGATLEFSFLGGDALLDSASESLDRLFLSALAEIRKDSGDSAYYEREFRDTPFYGLNERLENALTIESELRSFSEKKTPVSNVAAAYWRAYRPQDPQLERALLDFVGASTDDELSQRQSELGVVVRRIEREIIVPSDEGQESGRVLSALERVLGERGGVRLLPAADAVEATRFEGYLDLLRRGRKFRETFLTITRGIDSPPTFGEVLECARALGVLDSKLRKLNAAFRTRPGDSKYRSPTTFLLGPEFFGAAGASEELRKLATLGPRLKSWSYPEAERWIDSTFREISDSADAQLRAVGIESVAGNDGSLEWRAVLGSNQDSKFPAVLLEMVRYRDAIPDFPEDPTEIPFWGEAVGSSSESFLSSTKDALRQFFETHGANERLFAVVSATDGGAAKLRGVCERQGQLGLRVAELRGARERYQRRILSAARFLAAADLVLFVDSQSKKLRSRGDVEIRTKGETNFRVLESIERSIDSDLLTGAVEGLHVALGDFRTSGFPQAEQFYRQLTRFGGKAAAKHLSALRESLRVDDGFLPDAELEDSAAKEFWSGGERSPDVYRLIFGAETVSKYVESRFESLNAFIDSGAAAHDLLAAVGEDALDAEQNAQRSFWRAYGLAVRNATRSRATVRKVKATLTDLSKLRGDPSSTFGVEIARRLASFRPDDSAETKNRLEQAERELQRHVRRVLQYLLADRVLFQLDAFLSRFERNYQGKFPFADSQDDVSSIAMFELLTSPEVKFFVQEQRGATEFTFDDLLILSALDGGEFAKSLEVFRGKLRDLSKFLFLRNGNPKDPVELERLRVPMSVYFRAGDPEKISADTKRISYLAIDLPSNDFRLTSYTDAGRDRLAAEKKWFDFSAGTQRVDVLFGVNDPNPNERTFSHLRLLRSGQRFAASSVTQERNQGRFARARLERGGPWYIFRLVRAFAADTDDRDRRPTRHHPAGHTLRFELEATSIVQGRRGLARKLSLDVVLSVHGGEATKLLPPVLGTRAPKRQGTRWEPGKMPPPRKRDPAAK